MRTLLLAVFCWLFATATSFAQEEEPTIAEIREYCASFAQAEQVPEDELDEYIADCIEIEADAYGIESSPEDAS
jgi:hypothetical protein